MRCECLSNYLAKKGIIILTQHLEALIERIKVLPEWAVGPVVFISVLIILWIIKRAVYFHLRGLINKTRFKLYPILAEASSRPVSIMIVVISLLATQLFLQNYSSLSASFSDVLSSLSEVFFIFAIIMFAEKFARLNLLRLEATSSALRTSGSLLRGSLRVLIYLIGLLIILSSLSISITPIIASLGIGSLAIALALQPTLENFFSGIQILADKPIRVGDFIELESGEQGFVDKIGWRSTWIKMLPNNVVIMPNGALAKSKVINYYYPEKQLSVPVEVGVHYDSDLEHVERVTLEVAREILISHKWGVDDYDTFVIFHTFDSFSINFTVMLRAEEYFNRFFIKSAFIKALHKRFKEENIIIPYPINALNYTQESSPE